MPWSGLPLLQMFCKISVLLQKIKTTSYKLIQNLFPTPSKILPKLRENAYDPDVNVTYKKNIY